jgi:hypothetical protein
MNSLYEPILVFPKFDPLKVDGNEKQSGPGRRQMLGNVLGLMDMDIDRQGPRLMPNNCKNLYPP